MKPLRIAFAGTPDYAATSLQALLDGPHELVAVLTQPDRGAGRGKKIHKSPVKTLAEQHAIPVLQPNTLKDEGTAGQLNELDLDLMVVVAYGLLIPQAILDIPRLGCINVHGSLLPRWRGAAPIQRAIAMGDTQTGNTIMQMEASLDSGPMLLKESLAIGERETGGQLHDRLAEQGARLLSTVLSDLDSYRDQAQVQPDDGVTYAHKLNKDEARLDFRLPTRALDNQVRAFNPFPVAWIDLDGERLRIWQASEQSGDGDPGEILAVSDQGIDVATGDGALRLEVLQLPGKRAMAAADLLRGHAQRFAPGQALANYD